MALLIVSAEMATAQPPATPAPEPPKESVAQPSSPPDRPPVGDDSRRPARGATSTAIAAPVDSPVAEAANMPPDSDGAPQAAASGFGSGQADVGLGLLGPEAVAGLDLSPFALSGALADAGVGQGSFSAAPNMTGDLFGMGSAYVFGIDSLPPNQGGPQPIVLAGPGAATRRVKLSENFSPEVRNRCFLTYNYFHDAAGGLGDVNRWTLGLERILYDDLVSLEVRQPMATTLSSTQLTSAPGDRGYELGDMTLIGKAILYRDPRWVWTAGLGVTAPLADDAKLVENGETVLRIRNQAVYLLPYSAWLYRYDNDNLFQFHSQLDIDVNGNPISGNLFFTGPRDEGRYTDASLVQLDFSYHRILARNRRQAWVQDWIGNAELHYTGSLEDSPVFQGNGFTVTNIARRFNIVNATFSNHLVLRNNWVVTPGISVPLQNGTDRQFDFEATLQLNYLR